VRALGVFLEFQKKWLQPKQEDFSSLGGGQQRMSGTREEEEVIFLIL
jgi:hypothetical protein